MLLSRPHDIPGQYREGNAGKELHGGVRSGRKRLAVRAVKLGHGKGSSDPSGGDQLCGISEGNLVPLNEGIKPSCLVVRYQSLGKRKLLF
jgi:hypothetical protein